MKWFVRPFLGGLIPITLAVAACSTDPGVGTGSGTAGGGSGSGSGGTSTTGGSGSGSGSGGTGFTYRVPDGGATTGGGAGGAKPGSPSGESTCGFQKYMLERLPPELLLVLDRSGSMKSTVPGTMNNRWVETTAALDEVLMQTDQMVLWGLKMFPSSSACNVTAGVEVPIAATNYPMVGGMIKMTQPNNDQGGTPTAAAMRNALAYLRTVTSKNPKYVVLATDGEPNCGGMAVEAIAETRAAGFNTFVVGIATSGTGADRTLNMMAQAGGEPRQGMPQYYPVANKMDLVNALNQITARVSNCTFPLDKEPPSPNDVAVNVDGMRVQRDMSQQNGWNYGAGMKSIQIYGPLCDQLKSGKVANVDIIFGCPGVIIP